MTKNYIRFKNRIIFIHITIMLIWIGFGVRLFNIQVINRLNSPQGIKVESINGLRGNFYDINGKNLTQNLTFYRIGFHTKKISNTENLINELSSCTGTDKEVYIAKINSGRDYVELEKKTNKNCQQLQKKYPNVLIIKKSFKRYYPEDNLVSQIVGFTNIDDKGISGLEAKYNKFLEPVSGSKLSKRNGLGVRISDPTLPTEEAKNGADIVLTINKEYQAILRDELILQMEKVGAKASMGLILNPQTGAILSMVNLPDYNPNSPNDFDIELQKNKTVTDLIEPGSTFKIVTMAAALESDITLNEEINVEGPYNFHNIKMIEDSEPHEVLTLKEVLAFSSNIGTIKIAERLGRKSIYDQAREFGFGAKTGFDSSSEPSGIFREPSKWSLSSMHSIPIGYEVSATPLQIAMSYAAIANGGFLLKPYIVEKIEKHDDTIIKNQRNTKKRVLSRSNSEKLKSMLSHTVDQGSGKLAAIKGWNVAGKTGTSKKLINGQYSENEFISSFVGFFPSENPQLLCLIILDSPDASRNLHWGSMSAAPVFNSVVERILPLDDFSTLKRGKAILASVAVGVDTKNNEIKKEIVYVTMPDLIGKNQLEAYNMLKKVGLKTVLLRNKGGLIAFQYLEGGEEISPGDKVEIGTRIYLKAEIKE